MGIDIGEIMNAIKTLRDAAEKIKNADMIAQIADISIRLAEVKTEVAKLMEEKLKLAGQLDEFIKLSNIRAKLILRDNAYYSSEPIEGLGTGPFCVACFHREGKIVPLHVTSDRRDGIATYKGVRACPLCSKKHPKQ